MDTVVLRQELHDYINTADDKQLEAMYAVMQDEAVEPYEWWNDDELVKELERRSEDLKSGKDKGISWEESKKLLLNRVKQK